MPDWSYADGQSLSLLTTQGGCFASVQLSDGTPVHLVWDVSPNTDDRTHWYLLCGSALRNSVAVVASGTLVGKPAAFFAQALNGAGGMTQAFDLVVDGSDNLYVFLPPYFYDTAGNGNIFASVIPLTKGAGHSWTQGASLNVGLGQPASTFTSGGTGITNPWLNIASTAAFPATGFAATIAVGGVPVLAKYTAMASATSLGALTIVAGFASGGNQTVTGAAVVDPIVAMRAVWVNVSGGSGGGYILVAWTDSGGVSGYATLDAAALLAGTVTMAASGVSPAFLGSGTSGLPVPGVALAPSQFGSASGLATSVMGVNAAFRNAQNTNNTVAGTSLTITKPTGTATYDLLLAYIQVNQTNAALALTPPTGWTLLVTNWVGVGFPNIYVYAKTATAAEPASYTWTWTGSFVNDGVAAAYNTQGLEVTASAAITETPSNTTVNYPANPVPASNATPATFIYAALSFGGGAPTLTAPFGTTSRATFTPSVNQFAFFLNDQTFSGAPLSTAVTGTLSAAGANWGITVGLTPVASPVTTGVWSVGPGGTLSTNTLLQANTPAAPSTAAAQWVPSLQAVSPSTWIAMYPVTSGAVQADVATTAAYHIGSASPAVIGIPAFGKSLSPGGQVYSDPVIPNQAWLTYIDTVTLVTRKLRVLANAAATTVSWDAAAQSFDAAYPAAATIANLRVTPAPRAGIVDAIFTNSTASPVSVTGDHATLGPTPAAPVLTAPAYGAVADLAAGQPFAWTPDPANTERGLAFVRQAPGGTTEFFTGLQNLLSANDASFEGGVGTTVAIANCAVAQTAAQALDGTHSLAMTSTAAGNMSAGTASGASGYAVTAGVGYSWLSFYRSAVSARSVRTDVSWYNSAGTLISTTAGTAVTDATTGWVMSPVSGTAPAGAVTARLVYNVLATAAASEVHYVECAGIFPGRVPTPANANLVPDSDYRYPLNAIGINDATAQGWNSTGSGWTLSGGTAIYTAASGGAQSAGAIRSPASAPMPVTPGATMTVSVNIDATQVTSSQPAFHIDTPTGTLVVGWFGQGAGVKGTVSSTFVVPVGITQVRLAYELNNATMAAGATLTFSQPQLTATATAQPYTEGPTWSPGGLASWTAAEDWVLQPAITSITFPPGLWADNDTAYTWWVQTMSALLVPSPAPFPFAVTGSAPPTVVPSVSGLGTGTPSVSWSFTPGTATDVQSAYRVVVGPSGWNPLTTAPTWDSGTVASAATGPVATGASLPTGLAPGAWDWYVYVTESNGGVSGFVKVSGTIAYSAPGTLTLGAVYAAATNSVTLTATAGTNGNTVLFQYSLDGGTTWATVRNGGAVTIAGGSASVVDNDVCGAGSTIRYRAYQVAAGPLYSAASATQSVTPAPTSWFLKAPLTPSANSTVFVNAPFPTTQVEKSGVFDPLGQATETVVSDGIKGTRAVLHLDTVAANDWAALETLLGLEQVLLLQSPMGDNLYCFPAGDRPTNLIAAPSSVALYRKTDLTLVPVARP